MTVALPYDSSFVAQLIASHARFLGTPLIPPNVPADRGAAWLYVDAPFALLAHDAQPDPHFVYANLFAQHCFERSWDEIVGMPSRLSAEAPAREERAALLARVRAHGFANDYRGLRIAKSGRRFWIEQGTLWNVLDERGRQIGQAATFPHTRPHDAH